MNVDNLCMRCMNQSVENGICKECGASVGFIQEPSSSLPLQTILNGKYIVGGVIGHGGFGITYIAWDLEKNRKVAIKEYMPEGIATRAPGTTAVSIYSSKSSGNYGYGMNKFLEEARTIYRYRKSDNIIHVFELFEENSTAYYVMEYLEGSDLKEHIRKKGGRIHYTEALEIIRPVLEALRVVHKDSLIHRDISPDNIYLAKNGDVKLLDFGAARIALGEKSQNLSVILKRGYAPEEQYREKGKQGPWTDIYALGATLYEMITGMLPPQSTDRVFEDAIEAPQKICSTLPLHVNNAILKALAVRAVNRFQSIDEFQDALYNLTSVANAAQTPSQNPGVVYPLNPPSSLQNKSCLTSNEKLQFNQPINPISGEVYAGFWKRCAASLLDSILLNVAGGIILYSMGEEGGYVTFLALSVLYFSLMESSQQQATIGKMAVGIIVIDELGNRISFGKAFGRYLGKMVSALIFCVGFIMAAFTEKKQALHDLMANTFVVNKASQFSNIPVPNRIRDSYPSPKQRVDAMVAPVSISRASLRAVSGFYKNTSFPIGISPIKIGRDFNVCQIVFPQDTPGVSAIHCEVYIDARANSLILIDKGSSNGTYLPGGKKLIAYQPVSLYPGESFIIGDNNEFTFFLG